MEHIFSLAVVLGKKVNLTQAERGMIIVGLEIKGFLEIGEGGIGLLLFQVKLTDEKKEAGIGGSQAGGGNKTGGGKLEKFRVDGFKIIISLGG